MNRKAFQPGRGYTGKDWEDTDIPEASDEELAQAKPFGDAFPALADAIRKAGRPRSSNPKVAVSIRLDRDVVAAFKKTWWPPSRRTGRDGSRA